MFPTKEAILNSTLAQKYGCVSSAALLAVIPFEFYCFWNLIIFPLGLTPTLDLSENVRSEKFKWESDYWNSTPQLKTCTWQANKRTAMRNLTNGGVDKCNPTHNPSLGAIHRISLRSNKVLLILNPDILWNFAGMSGRITFSYRKSVVEPALPEI